MLGVDKALRKAAKGCGAGRGLGRKLRRGAVAAAGYANEIQLSPEGKKIVNPDRIYLHLSIVF